MTKIFIKGLMFCFRKRFITLQLTIVVNFHDNSQCVIATSIEDLFTNIDL